MSDLASKQCVPCRGGVRPIKGAELQALLRDIDNGWQIIDEHHLEKEYRFKNFREALDFVIRVGELAEEQRHHPNIYLAWGEVRLTVWTHKIDGLTESDFVFAAKADRLGGELNMAPEFVTITRADDVKPGELAAFEVGGVRVAVANVEGTFYAFGDTCPHADCSLAEGDMDGTTVTCPCHGSEFDVTSGEVLSPPAVESVKSYRVRIEQGALAIEV